MQGESHLRSVLKGISWRVVGTLTTWILSLFITAHAGTATKIAIAEVVTKLILYWFHERIWQFFAPHSHSHAISVAKSISWRVVGTLDTFVWSWFFTGSLAFGINIASIDAVVKMLLYYLHERLWLLIPPGKVHDFQEKFLGRFKKKS